MSVSFNYIAFQEDGVFLNVNQAISEVTKTLIQMLDGENYCP